MLFLSAYSVSGYALIFYDIGNTVSYIIKAYGWMRIAAYFKSIACVRRGRKNVQSTLLVRINPKEVEDDFDR